MKKLVLPYRHGKNGNQFDSGKPWGRALNSLAEQDVYYAPWKPYNHFFYVYSSVSARPSKKLLLQAAIADIR